MIYEIHTQEPPFETLDSYVSFQDACRIAGDYRAAGLKVAIRCPWNDGQVHTKQIRQTLVDVWRDKQDFLNAQLRNQAGDRYDIACLNIHPQREYVFTHHLETALTALHNGAQPSEIGELIK